MKARWLATGLVSAGVSSALLMAVVVSAATPQPAPPPGEGIQISPPVIEASADPGQTVTLTIKLQNLTSGTMAVQGHADDFGAKGEDGVPQVLLDETEATRYSLKYWIPSVPDVNLEPLKQQTLSIPVKVPANAEPGGHYGVIRFTAIPTAGSGNHVSLVASIGTLVLLKVNGPVEESLKVEAFSAQSKGKTKNFFEYGPVDFLERLKNDGTVHVKPVGSVSIFNIFGHQVATLDVNKNPSGNVLPDSIRRFTQTYNHKPLFGRYRARLDLTYGTSNTKLVAYLSFWVIPYKLILLVVLGLMLLIIGLRLLIKRYNRYIIEQARRQ